MKKTTKTKPKNTNKSKNSDLTKAKPKTKKQLGDELKKARMAQWKTCEPSFLMVMDCDPIPPSDEAMECETPVDFFSLFFNNALLDHICEQSNLYALRKNVNLNLTNEELLVFFGGLLLSGYVKYPNKRLYWSKENDAPALLSESIRCNRFEQILRFLHLNDNNNLDTSDRLYKLRPYIDSLSNSFLHHGGLDENLSVDESMIPYYGRHYAKQFIRGKPIRFGFKNKALCSSSGYLVAFDIYTGKDTDRLDKFGLRGDVVMRLVEKAQVPANSGHKLYIDNYFTSVPLIKHLGSTGICATGTLRADRTEHCTVKSIKDLQNEERGSFDFRTAENIMVVRWHDNSVCTVATNCENFSVGRASRWSREQKAKVQVPQPTVFSKYNKGMGGVDLLDQGIAAYRTRIRQKKWWWPIFIYLFDACVVNAWLLNRKLLPADLAIHQLLKVSEEFGYHATKEIWKTIISKNTA
ncbi:piggyBac transposable element-derived protein 2-like [Macrosteles quadrilineatus]|uniref:piggyBac transposable element-derived protein 2-like n=1 Tax=Macrosteles quadrilineatus TaxID=74068 RepID=UPI0023E174BD|nr:piggyBac transposable element-derived protein 2-like [Macrosteles quadrilineatus]